MASAGLKWWQSVMHQHFNTSYILAHILLGTTIVTDAWRGYSNTGQINSGIFERAIVVHAIEFIDSVHREIHTDTIESLWIQVQLQIQLRYKGQH